MHKYRTDDTWPGSRICKNNLEVSIEHKLNRSHQCYAALKRVNVTLGWMYGNIISRLREVTIILFERQKRKGAYHSILLGLDCVCGILCSVLGPKRDIDKLGNCHRTVTKPVWKPSLMRKSWRSWVCLAYKRKIKGDTTATFNSRKGYHVEDEANFQNVGATRMGWNYRKWYFN